MEEIHIFEYLRLVDSFLKANGYCRNKSSDILRYYRVYKDCIYVIDIHISSVITINIFNGFIIGNQQSICDNIISVTINDNDSVSIEEYVSSIISVSNSIVYDHALRTTKTTVDVECTYDNYEYGSDDTMKIETNKSSCFWFIDVYNECVNKIKKNNSYSYMKTLLIDNVSMCDFIEVCLIYLPNYNKNNNDN